MTWLVWRRQRPALLVALGLVAATAVLVLVARLVLGVAVARAGALACVADLNSPACLADPVFVGLRHRQEGVRLLAAVAGLVLPVVVGVTAGAGLFARELEQGTVVLALTQSVSRLRWWASGLLVAGVPAAVAATLLAAFANWALPLYRGPGVGRLEAPSFDVTGLAPTAHALLAFTLAAVAGLVLRNALGAVVLTVVVQLVLQLALVGLRPHYAPADELRAPLPPNGAVAGSADAPPAGSSFVGSTFLYADGRAVPDAALDALPCEGEIADIHDCLRAAGVTQQRFTYHDAARYWPFQAIEAAILLGVVAALLGTGAASLRRIG